MAITNHERVGKALDLLRDGLLPFIQRELELQHGKYWITAVTKDWKDELHWGDDDELPHLDVAIILRIMWDQWNLVIRKTLGHAERSIVSELREVRNKWAHQEPFSSDDAYRALDSASRLLTAVSAPQAAELDKMKIELLRLRFDEQVRSQKRKTGTGPIGTQGVEGLKPWREVVSPHKDVASGKYQQAEFAADLWQVHLGEGSAEYKNPKEFFQRTFLTDSLTSMLVGAVCRLTGEGGDPVVQLQTNFGGGKTHSMLALYHLFSGAAPGDLAGVDAILAEAGFTELPEVKRVVIVGNRISPGNPSQKTNGTTIRTLWGEMAWQLGLAAGGLAEAQKAFELVEEDDKKATNPGDTIRELMNKYSPCLILIDEWVAYARQLHDDPDLPGGSFETHFTFAQALSESAKLAKNCLLVISLPASDTGSSPHAQADNAEVGGERGREALVRLGNVIGRVESSWRPASAEEGFEIVRRRLFEPLIDKDQFLARDTTARAFYDLYRTQEGEFPTECTESNYETRLKAAYPIHPEVFDRLYTDWSTLVKFQRTRGVLRLMASVIHYLWESGDRNPLILPAHVALDDNRVQFELTRYLPDNWIPIIEKDVDGPNALPARLDADIPNLGKYGASRRVARTIYLGSAPTPNAANRGLDEKNIRLGCVMPGEPTAIFGDALRRLANSATYLYQDGTHYWYSTQPTVTKLADDRKEEYKRDPDSVAKLIEDRLQVDLQERGDFVRIHAFPQSPADVPEDMNARLVVLGITHPYTRDTHGPAKEFAQSIFESRGAAPRIFRNSLIFLAIDGPRLQDLDEAARTYLAWQSILDDKDRLDLTNHQVKQAQERCKETSTTLTARIPEAYQWLLIPVQSTPQDEMGWQAIKVSGQDALAVRASRKLRNDELLVTGLAGTRLRLELDRIPLWRGDHVSVDQLIDDFARYIYLPRIKGPDVLRSAVQDGVALLTWEQDSFAYADSFDETEGRYRGLRTSSVVTILEGRDSGLIIKPEVALGVLAKRKLDRLEIKPKELSLPPGESVHFEVKGYDELGHELELPPLKWVAEGGDIDARGYFTAGGNEGDFKIEGAIGEIKVQAVIQISKIAPPLPPPPPPIEVGPKRFHGTVVLDSSRVGRDAGNISEEVLAHLVGLVGSEVRVTLEIDAKIPDGASEHVVRTVTENCRTLKFDNHGFEKE